LGNTDKTEILNVIGDVDEKIALVFDDEILTGDSILNVVNTVLERGAKEAYICCTHSLFTPSAVEGIAASPVIEVVVTDTVPISDGKILDKVTILPIAPLLGEASHRIHTGISVGAMFE
jgi:ribose-phosphate pyrophosphokinase